MAAFGFALFLPSLFHPALLTRFSRTQWKSLTTVGSWKASKTSTRTSNWWATLRVTSRNVRICTETAWRPVACFSTQALIIAYQASAAGSVLQSSSLEGMLQAVCTPADTSDLLSKNQLTSTCEFSDFEAFADAAEEFHPHIKFYATFNTKVCKRLWFIFEANAH